MPDASPSGEAVPGPRVPAGARVDRGPAVFYVVEHESPHGPSHLRYLSPQVLDLTGYEAEAFLADPEFEQQVVHAADRARRSEAERNHLESGEPLFVEYRVRTRSGATAWIRDEAARLTTEADGRLFSHGMLIDITAEKRLQARLAIQVAILELIARNAPLADILEELVALVDAEMVGSAASVLLVEDGLLLPATNGRLAAPYVEVLRRGVPVVEGAGTCGTAAARAELVVTRGLALDPAWTPFPDFLSAALDAGYQACWSKPILSAEGSVHGTFAMYLEADRAPDKDEEDLAELAARVAGVAVDRVRDQERWQVAEKAAARSEHRVRELLRHVTLAAVIVDANGKILFANDALVESTGFSGRLVGRDWFKVFIPPEDRAAEVQRFRRAIESGRMDGRYENQILTRTGERRQYVWHTSIVRDRRGRISAVASIGEDATERLRLEAQLRESQKQEAIGRLAGGVAHDFNNLLTAITGYADLLLGQVGENAPGTEELAEIRKASERATALTRQLLAFARRQPLEPRVVNLGTVLAEIEPLLRRLIGEHIELSTDVAPDAFVLADPTQIEQVIVNLAVNARDAMPSGGRLTMTVRVQADRRQRDRGSGEPGDKVILRVDDTGHGMDDTTQAHAFEPFYTTKGPGEGTGLGLSTVYGIVNGSGGTVSLESGPGQGTSVTVALPKSFATEAASVTPPTSQPSPGAGTILVVEDEDSVRNLIKTVLERHGFEVFDAPSGARALEWAARRDGPLDLLVTDIVMPGINGREVAERLAATRPRLPVLYLSGYTADVLRSQLPLPPGQSFLAKPFTPDELATRVEAVLGEARRPLAS